jgi:DinB superfamily
VVVYWLELTFGDDAGVAQLAEQLFCKQQVTGSIPVAGSIYGGIAMEADERARLIKRYRDGHRVVMEALSGITPEELDRSDSGEWRPRQTAHHLADSEMMSAIRIRRLLTENEPEIHGYDEAAFARMLTLDRPIEPSLEAMRWARETSAPLLERMTEEDWRKVGTHTESGPYSAEDWLTIYAAHAHDHAEQIKRARGES